MAELLHLIAAGLTLFHFLGLWGTLALVAAIVALGWAVCANGEFLLEWLIHRQARAIGRVMKGATVTVHAITPAPEPDPSVWRTGDDEEDDEFEAQLEASGLPEGEYHWFKIDVTIAPKADDSGIAPSWEPSMIQLRKDDGESRDALELDIDCLMAQVERWQGGEFVVSDNETLEGSARIRLYVGVVPGTQDVRLSYLGEEFASVRLPSRSRVLA